MKELMEINRDNYYVQHAAEIKAICDEHGCDIAQAVIRFDNDHAGGTVEASKEFLHLVNEQLRTKDKDGMTLDKLIEQL